MTDAQWEVLKKSLAGKYVNSWSGWVEEVNEKLFGGYELLVDMDPPNEPLSVQDVTFDIPDDIALKLQKDQPVVFSGIISSVGWVLGSCQISLDEAVINQSSIPSAQTLSSEKSESTDTPSFQEIRSKMTSMTEAQRNIYAKGLENKTVSDWTGWVEDVNKKLLGGYELWVDMDSPNELLSVQDITFDIPNDLALKLQKDSKVTFSGKIEIASNTLESLSIKLVEATVTPN